MVKLYYNGEYFNDYKDVEQAKRNLSIILCTYKYVDEPITVSDGKFTFITYLSKDTPLKVHTFMLWEID